MSKELKTTLIIGGVIVAIVALLVAVSRYQAGQKPDASEAIIRDNSHFVGGAEAKAVLVEFGDFQCPACAQAEPLLTQIKTEYGDRLKFVYRNFPLSFHLNAEPAARAAEAAANQGKFWEMHNLLFTNQTAWASLSNPTDTFKSYAQQLDLDMDKFNSDLSSQEVKDRVRSDQKDGEALAVTGTPTFFLNGQKLDNYSYDELKSKIDQILADAGDQPADTQATESAQQD